MNFTSLLRNLSSLPHPPSRSPYPHSSRIYVSLSPRDLIETLLSQSAWGPHQLQEWEELQTELVKYNDDLHNKMAAIVGCLITAIEQREEIKSGLVLNGGVYSGSQVDPPKNPKAIVRLFLHNASLLRPGGFQRLQEFLTKCVGDCVSEGFVIRPVLEMANVLVRFGVNSEIIDDDFDLLSSFNARTEGVNNDNVDSLGLVTKRVDATSSYKLPQQNCGICSENFYSPLVGFETTSFRGFAGQLVCPSMFRDLSDYVLNFPFEKYGEYADLMPEILSSGDKFGCLAPVPALYWSLNERNEEEIRTISSIPFPFILISGQSDSDSPSKYSQILANPNLKWWFGQNGDLNLNKDFIEKFTAIPIGINCYDTARGLSEFYRNYRTHSEKESENKKNSLLFLVNFSTSTNAVQRAKVKSFFCGDRTNAYAKVTKCIQWDGLQGQHRNIGSVDTVKEHFRLMSKFKYVVSPAGHGRDTHRVWEALYVGSVPVVKRTGTVLDTLYDGLPVLVVEDFDENNLVLEELEDMWENKFKQMFATEAVQKRLRRDYYHDIIESKRIEILDELGMSNVDEKRGQCWRYGI